MRKAVRILAVIGFATMIVFAVINLFSLMSSLQDVDMTEVRSLFEASDIFVIVTRLLPSATLALVNTIIVFYTFFASFSKKRRYVAEIVFLSIRCAALPVSNIIMNRLTSTSYASRISRLNSIDFSRFYSFTIAYMSSALSGGYAEYFLIVALALLLADKALAKKYADDTFEGVENYN